MNPQTYQKRRDELLGLLGEAISLNVPEPHLSDLKQAHRKCQEDQFEIALVGEFQGGKSTTFNTLCDGREISPRGLNGGGLKTSAGIITAQHLSDPNELERVEVAWRTRRELILGMGSLIKPYLWQSEEVAKALGQEIEPVTPDEQLAELIDPYNPTHATWINEALSLQWQKWSENKGAYSGNDLDQLFISTLQMRFLANREIVALMGRPQLNIAEFQKLIAFPTDWLSRWKAGSGAEFTATEVGFVFVSQALVRIHSPGLAKLGCRVTDCPGLFVSKWDTDLAHEVMNRSDAIWYLIRGDRAMNQDDKKILSFIRDNGWTDKLHVSFNLRSEHEKCLTGILPETRAALDNMGLEKTTIHPYNAFMAFRSEQGQRLMSGDDALAPSDQANLKSEALATKAKPESVASPKAAWVRVVSKHCATALNEENFPSALDAESLSRLRSESRLNDIRTAVEDCVVSSKPHGVLVGNGANLAVAALARYEGDLELEVKNAFRTEEEFEAEVSNAKASLDEFKLYVKAKIGELKDRVEIDREIAEAFWNQKKKKIIRDTAEKAWPIVDKEVCIGANIVGVVWNKWSIMEPIDSLKKVKKALSDQTKAIVAPAINESARTSATAWAKGENLKPLSSVMDETVKEIHDEWGERSTEIKLLEGIPFPEQVEFNASNMKVNMPFDLNILNAIFASLDWDAILRATIDQLSQWATVYPKAAIVLKLLAASLGKVQPKPPVDIYETCLNKAMETNEASVLMSVRDGFATARREHISRIEAILKKVEAEFLARVKQARARFKLAQSDRTAKAAQANQTRIHTIQPMRERIEAFKKSVEKDLAPTTNLNATSREPVVINA